MKILSLLIILFALTDASYAAPTYFKAVAFSSKSPTSSVWSEWVDVDLIFLMDINTKHIEILSKRTQIFDYIGFVQKDFNSGTIHGSFATDTNYNKVYIEFTLYDTGLALFTVKYSDIEYRYVLTVLD